jgi:hypothetical protein
MIHKLERNMLTDIPGTACRFEELAAGDCFVYARKDDLIIAIRLKAAETTSRVLILCRGTHGEPFIPPGTQRGSMVCHKLDATLECKWSAATIDLRDGVNSAGFGQLVAAGTQRFLYVRDGASDDDPVLVNLETGERAYGVEGPAVVFSEGAVANVVGNCTARSPAS